MPINISPVVSAIEYEGRKNDPSMWTAIIPAAGHGTRLGYSKAKILYPLIDKPLLGWLIDSLSEVVDNFVFIFSEEGAAQCSDYLKEALHQNYKIVIQDSPTGMADAILLAKKQVITPFSLVIWGDQAAVKKATLEKCCYLHEVRFDATLTMPTILKRNPYIDIIRDESQNIVAVRQAREGEINRSIGENDCGVFLFTSKLLFQILEDEKKNESNFGKKTREFNLLPLIPKFYVDKKGIVSVRIEDANEALGINTPEDVLKVEAVLRDRNGIKTK